MEKLYHDGSPTSFGQEKPDVYFYLVGLSLTHWEHLEQQFSHIFTQLMGSSFYIGGEVYGRINGAAARHELLRAAIDAFFFDGRREAEFYKEITDILKEVSQTRGMRNKLAHGHVNSFRHMNAGKVEHDYGYWLIAPSYDTKKNSMFDGPAYHVDTAQIEKFISIVDQTTRSCANIAFRIQKTLAPQPPSP